MTLLCAQDLMAGGCRAAVNKELHNGLETCHHMHERLGMAMDLSKVEEHPGAPSPSLARPCPWPPRQSMPISSSPRRPRSRSSAKPKSAASKLMASWKTRLSVYIASFILCAHCLGERGPRSFSSESLELKIIHTCCICAL